MKALAEFFEQLFRRASVCSLVGALVGGIVGLLFGLLQGALDGDPLTNSELLQIALMLGVAAWIVVLVFVGLWLRYGVRNIAVQALFNAVVTGVVTVFVLNQVDRPLLACLFGIVIGLFVGAVLCWWCRIRDLSTGNRHGG